MIVAIGVVPLTLADNVPPPTISLLPPFWVKVPVPLTPTTSMPPTKSARGAVLYGRQGVDPRTGCCCSAARLLVVQSPPTIRPMGWTVAPFGNPADGTAGLGEYARATAYRWIDATEAAHENAVCA